MVLYDLYGSVLLDNNHVHPSAILKPDASSAGFDLLRWNGTVVDVSAPSVISSSGGLLPQHAHENS